MSKPSDKTKSILDTIHLLRPRNHQGANINNDILPDVSIDLGYRLAWSKVPCPIPAHIDKTDALLAPAHKIKTWNNDAEELVRKQYRSSQLMAQRDEHCKKTKEPVVLADFEKVQDEDLKRASIEYREVSRQVEDLQNTLLSLIKKKEGKSKSLWKMCVEKLNLNPVTTAFVYDFKANRLLSIDPNCPACYALHEVFETKKEVERRVKDLPLATKKEEEK